jgi:hypothetical protein
MSKLLLFYIVSCAIACIVATAPAQATSPRTFVSASGSDSNACTQAAPCLTFAHAFTQTTSGGEIDCLSGGDYGPVTITASITIDCGPGNLAMIGVTSSNSNGITVNLATTGVVVIRNLSITAFGAVNAVRGVFTQSFPDGSELYIENVRVKGLPNAAIYFAPTGNRGILAVSNTSLIKNGVGVYVDPGNGVIASAIIDGVKILGCSTGVELDGPGVIAGALRHSVVAESLSDGVSVTALPGQVFFTIEESSIIDNVSAGVETASSGAILNVGATTIGGNGTGVKPTAGSIISFGNNQMSANGANGAFSSTAPLQ